MAISVMVTIQVEDFAKWKGTFDGAALMREKMGISIKGIYQSAEDEKQVILISEYPTMEAAKAVLESPVWAETQKKAGVIGGFNIKFLHQIA